MKFSAKMPRSKPEVGAAYIVFSVKDSFGNRIELDGKYPDSVITEVWDALKGKDLKWDRDAEHAAKEKA